MKIRRLLLVLSLLRSVSTHSQGKISGYVASSNNKPLAFASVLLLQDSTFLLGTTTDEAGTFSILFNFEQHRPYFLQISLVGYQTFRTEFIYPDTLSPKKIVLIENKNILGVVTVTAKKPLITRKPDRYIINVDNSFLANGNSGLEVLQKSPGLWVDNNGRIRIKGNQSVIVMINDIVQRMSEEELGEYLKTIKSEDISKIEVIQNPPSEFEAAGSGGIIHIILKKTRRDGFTGSIYARYKQQGRTPLVSTGTSQDYTVKNLYVSGSYSFTNDKLHSFATNNVIYPDGNIYSNYTNRVNNDTRRQYRFFMTYELSKNQSLGIQILGTSNKLIQSFNTDVNFRTDSNFITGKALSEWIRTPDLRSTTINYLWKVDSLGSTLKVIGDYTKSKKKEINDFSSIYSDTLKKSNYKNSTPSSTDIYSLQGDYVKILKNKIEIKSGVKFSSIVRDNTIIREDLINGNWVADPAGSNNFLYKERLLMLYSSIEKTIGKTSLKLGLRAEETYINGNSVSSNEKFSRKYFGLFPSFFITRTLNEGKGNVLYFNYVRRLQRPAFTELNPYRLQFDDYTLRKGNPDLLAEYSHKLEFGATLFNNYSADVYFQEATNTIAILARPLANNVIEYQYHNFNNTTQYGFDLNFPIPILKNWTSNNAFSVYNLSYSVGNFDINQTTFYGKSVQSITLKKLFDIDAIADYRSHYVYANSRIPYMFSCDISLAKKVLKNNGRIRAYFSDIFNTLRDREVTDYSNTHIDFYQKRPSRTVSLSFTYNFSSGKKFSNKKIEQNNSAEKGRIEN